MGFPGLLLKLEVSRLTAIIQSLSGCTQGLAIGMGHITNCDRHY